MLLLRFLWGESHHHHHSSASTLVRSFIPSLIHSFVVHHDNDDKEFKAFLKKRKVYESHFCDNLRWKKLHINTRVGWREMQQWHGWCWSASSSKCCIAMNGNLQKQSSSLLFKKQHDMRANFFLLNATCAFQVGNEKRCSAGSCNAWTYSSFVSWMAVE